MPVVVMRFYEELNDFLPAERRKTSFQVSVSETQTVKDIIEACGVPHVEVDLVVVDGESVDFSHRPAAAERIAVYPVFESVDITPVVRLRPSPLRTPRFIIDANLGRLARLLRLLGFDCLYDRDATDARIAERSARDNLILLTRDRRLLMRKVISRGYFVRSQIPRRQAAEVVARFDLYRLISPLTRCTECNGLILPVPREQILNRIPIRTRLYIREFRQCADCRKIFWRGAHWPNVERLVDEIMSAAGESLHRNSEALSSNESVARSTVHDSPPRPS